MPVPIENTPYLYFPVPKVACTSVKSGILAHNDPAKHEQVVMQRSTKKRYVHNVYRTSYFRAVPYSLRWRHKKWICIVRDPIKRAISGYRNRIMHHEDLKLVAPEKLERRGLSVAPDFHSFVQNLEDYCDVSRLVHHHFAPHCAFLGKRPERFHRVFELSQLDDMKEMIAAEGVTLEFPHDQTGGPPMSMDDLTAYDIETLRKFYAEDYRVWGTYFEPVAK